MSKPLILLMLVIVAALLVCSCQLFCHAPPPAAPSPAGLQADLVSLSFSESHSYNQPVQGYTFRTEDGTHTVYFHLAKEEDPYPVAADQAWVDALAEIVSRYDLISWDGFNRNMEGLLDGTSFSLTLAFSDGTTVSARGYGSFPKDYGEASKAIEAHFLTLLPEDKTHW